MSEYTPTAGMLRVLLNQPGADAWDLAACRRRGLVDRALRSTAKGEAVIARELHRQKELAGG